MQLEWIMATSTIYLCMQKSWAFLCGENMQNVWDRHAIGGIPCLNERFKTLNHYVIKQ